MGATGLLLAATGIQATAGLVGSYTQSRAQKEQSRYQQQIFESNARMAEIQAKDAIYRGERDASEERLKGRRVRGSQRAAFAGQGVDVDAGTAGDIQSETAMLSEMSALTAQNNAWREAWGFTSEASNLRSQGKMARLAGKNESKNTLLTGGLRFASDLTRGAYTYYSGQPKSMGRKPTESRFSADYKSNKWGTR